MPLQASDGHMRRTEYGPNMDRIWTEGWSFQLWFETI